MRLEKLLSLKALIILVLVTLALIVGFILYRSRPRITHLSKTIIAPGDELIITGNHFGKRNPSSRLFIGGAPITSTSILEWEKEQIIIRVPKYNGSVLVKVKNRLGFSNARVLADATRFPEVSYGSWVPGAPFIEYIFPTEGGPGTLVSLQGKGFGAHQNFGRIWINNTDTSQLLGTEEPDTRRYIEAKNIDFWSEKEIRFWMPGRIQSGNIYVYKSSLFSNPHPFMRLKEPGYQEIGSPRYWSLQQEFSIQRIGALPGNTLYWHLPAPELGVGQKEAAVIEKNQDALTSLVRRQDNVSLYRFHNLSSGQKIALLRQLIVPVAPLKTFVQSRELRRYDPNNPKIAAALKTDQWIKPQEVAAVARRIVGNSNNDWDKALQLYNHVIDTLSYTENPPSRDIAQYFSTSLADSQGYSFLFSSLARAVSIPTRPVGGILVLENLKTRSWWWAEIWIEGIGWVPVDPALGDGAGDIKLPGLEGEAALYYWGSLEGRHIAFSRGILEVGPLQRNADLRIPHTPYTLQDSWEEVSGNLESYDSSWPIPWVSAVYPSGLPF